MIIFNLFHPLSAFFSLFQPLSVSFSLFRPFSAFFSLFQPLSASFSLFQPLSAFFSLFQPLSASFSSHVLPCANVHLSPWVVLTRSKVEKTVSLEVLSSKLSNVKFRENIFRRLVNVSIHWWCDEIPNTFVHRIGANLYYRDAQWEPH